MSTTRTTRSATGYPIPRIQALAGHDDTRDGQISIAIEGQDSPQVIVVASPKAGSPAENRTTQPAVDDSTPMDAAPAGHQAGRDQPCSDTQMRIAPATFVPGAQDGCDTQGSTGTGELTPPVAILPAAPMIISTLADPFLALAADVLDDLEKVRIANENRLRQLTRSTEDKDGETRGFGLDEAHPDVARLAALVDMLADAEHKATLNLARVMRNHPLGPWVKAQKGIGEKQGARLLATIGDPYVRPEIIREDGTVEPSRPRLVSELWAFCGYHVIKTPVSGHATFDGQGQNATDGPGFPADHTEHGIHGQRVGGGSNGHPGHIFNGAYGGFAGVAPKRARGQKANWSAAAKMRAFLVAESCIKKMDSPYRKVYDAAREKYANAAHVTECIRCGPKGKPALPGTPLSDGHKHARALRAVAKEVLRDLWREAKWLHEQAPVSGHDACGTRQAFAANGPGISDQPLHKRTENAA